MGITMRWLLIAVALNFCYSTLKVDGHRASSNAPVMMQMPVQGNRPLVNPTVCVGITAFIVGTAIGIGIGVLISNNRYRGVGGGTWFGRRRRRSLEYQDIDQEDEEQEAFQILENINDGAIKYQYQ